MEINELKNIWSDLDKKLDQNKSLNDKIIKNMLQSKGNKSVSRLINIEILSAIGLILLIPIFILINNKIPNVPMSNILMQVMIIYCVLGTVWYSVKIFYLFKISFNGSLKNNIYNINKYNVLIKREVQASFIIIPITIAICALLYAELNVPFFLWIFLACIFAVIIILIIWIYKSFYKKHITSITQSLEELKALDEE